MPDILYFAWLRDRLGRERETLTLPSDVTHVQDLVRLLHDRGGEYGEVFSRPELVRVAVNQSFATLGDRVGPDDEIAFFPPVTGG